MNHESLLGGSVILWGFVIFIYTLASFFRSQEREPTPIWAYPGLFIWYTGFVILGAAALCVLAYPFLTMTGFKFEP